LLTQVSLGPQADIPVGIFAPEDNQSLCEVDRRFVVDHCIIC
jgi:hypothetical protein